MDKPLLSPALASDQDIAQLASLFKLLSEIPRFQILCLLAQGERHVTSLCNELNLSSSTVCNHLGFLIPSNLLTRRLNGGHVYYALASLGPSGKNHVLELPLQHLVVKILSKSKHGPSAGRDSDQDVDELTSLFQLLSHTIRVQTLMLLSQDEMNVKFLCKELKRTQTNVGGHLTLLRVANVVRSRRHGTQRIYRLAGRITSGKDGLLEFGTEHLVVRVLAKANALAQFNYLWREHAVHRSRLLRRALPDLHTSQTGPQVGSAPATH